MMDATVTVTAPGVTISKLVREYIATLNIGHTFHSEYVAEALMLHPTLYSPVSSTLIMLEKVGMIKFVGKRGRFKIYEKVRDLRKGEIREYQSHRSRTDSKVEKFRKGKLSEALRAGNSNSISVSFKIELENLRRKVDVMLETLSEMDACLERLKND